MPYFYDRINTIYQFIKPFLDKKLSFKKCLFLQNMEPVSTRMLVYIPHTWKFVIFIRKI